ncbi:MAG: hypothetical protein QRY72_02675 [Candidatus Rhabdochlamydia sp.]
MKKILYPFLVCAIVMASSPSLAEESLQDWQTETEELWTTPSGAHDELTTLINASMLTWGFGLGIGIAILAAVLGQGNSAQSPSSTP